MKKELPESPFTIATVYSVDDYELRMWINKTLSIKNFEITEVANDSTIKFDIGSNDKEEFSKSPYYLNYEKPEALEIIENSSCEGWNLKTLFTYLWVEGYIEAGTYNIDISW